MDHAELRGANLVPQILEEYRRENTRGISKRGTAYWLILRLHLGGVPIIGGPELPDVSPELIDDLERIGRLPD